MQPGESLGTFQKSTYPSPKRCIHPIPYYPEGRNKLIYANNSSCIANPYRLVKN
jgi:hypothetical protein